MGGIVCTVRAYYTSIGYLKHTTDKVITTVVTCLSTDTAIQHTIDADRSGRPYSDIGGFFISGTERKGALRLEP